MQKEAIRLGVYNYLGPIEAGWIITNTSIESILPYCVSYQLTSSRILV